MVTLNRLDKQRTWNRAKDCINAALKRSEYFCDEWPERIGFHAVAALQAMGDASDMKAWETLLHESDIPIHIDSKVGCIGPLIKTFEYWTVRQESERDSRNVAYTIYGIPLVVDCGQPM